MAKNNKTWHTNMAGQFDSDSPKPQTSRVRQEDLPVPDKEHPAYNMLVRMHPVGQCPERSYGVNCDGIGHWGPDPYAEELAGDSTPLWLCEGVRTGRAMDI
jgi:hypothetical protein